MEWFYNIIEPKEFIFAYYSMVTDHKKIKNETSYCYILELTGDSCIKCS